MLLRRVLASLIFAPALLYLVWRGGWMLEVATMVLATLMLWEFLQLVMPSGAPLFKGYAYILGMLLGGCILDWWPQPIIHAAMPMATVVLLGLGVLRPKPIESAMVRTGLVLLGVVYTYGLIPYLARLRQLDDIGLGLGMAALFCTWGADTGAYFIGRKWGRHPLYTAVSPGKTIEGVVGGVMAAIASALIIRALFDVPVSLLPCVVVGVVAGCVGVLGDLAESLLKRSAGAKDSSRLIPGHGGVLDRFDAVLFVAPSFYILALIVHNLT